MQLTIINNILLVTFFQANFISSQIFSYKKGARIDLLRLCGEDSQPIMYSNKLILLNRKQGTAIYAEVNLTIDLPRDFQVFVIPQRCNSVDSPDTCESLRVFRLQHACELMNMDNKPWSSFADSVIPKLHCPVKKNIYAIENATFNMDLFCVYPLENWYWKVKFRVVDGSKKHLFTLCMNCRLFKYKV